MPITKVGDISIEYHVDGDGPPLLLIHGLGMSAHAWDERFLDELRPHFRVIRFSNRGTGLTDKPNMDYSYQMMADDAAGLLNELGIGVSHVAGVSMGGRLAQHMALNHASAVRGLVLGCTGPGGVREASQDPDAVALMAPSPGLSTGDLIRRGWPAIYTQSFIDREQDYLEETLRIQLEHPTSLGTLQRHAAARFRPDAPTYEKLPEIQAPTLIIHGDQDRLVPVQNAHILYDRIPNSTLHIVPGTGHGFATEKPRESAEAIVEFLSSIRNVAASLWQAVLLPDSPRSS